MKMFEEINKYRKDYVYEQYTRIVEDFKEYEKISKNKMLEAIYKVYSDYNNIIDICTTRELKYLKKILTKKEDYTIDKYDWEIMTLQKKFLIADDFKDINIPEEILDYVKTALKKVDWEEKKKKDDLNEILVSYCKMQGTALLLSVCQFVSCITEIEGETIWNHMLNDKLFNYYVLIAMKNIETFEEDMPVAIYQDYIDFEENIELERKKQGLGGVKNIDLEIYKTLFYNDFDINNSKIKKFLDKIKSLPFFWPNALKLVREYSMLNIDREPLKQAIQDVPSLKGYDLTSFFKVMNEAMDEMPSGALNGYTPNEAKEIKVKQIESLLKKEKNYHMQQNACLSNSDAKLFYKIYFGLLEFTNKKYKINLRVKIYKHKGINANEIRDIVDKFWENKDLIIVEFCLANPYKFNKEELEIASEFKKGFRALFIIVKYEEEYTAFMHEDKIYMVKGLHDNIDRIISYKDLPNPTITSIMPFKNNLIYDGMLLNMSVKLGNEINTMFEKEYNRMMKYYHL